MDLLVLVKRVEAQQNLSEDESSNVIWDLASVLVHNLG